MTSPLTGLLAVAAVLVAATVFGLVRRSRDGRLRAAPAAPEAAVFAGLGVEMGTPVTLTPTLFVLDGAGRVVRRATGVPARAELRAAVDDALAVRGVR